jgi:thiamine biosynthesis protein ThiS
LAHTLKINGVEKEFSADVLPDTLAELLEQMNIKQATVVAEIDGIIINRDDFSNTKIKPGQSIELVRFVGGG